MSWDRNPFKTVNETPGPGAYDPHSPENRYRQYGFLTKASRFSNNQPQGTTDLARPGPRSRQATGCMRTPSRVTRRPAVPRARAPPATAFNAADGAPSAAAAALSEARLRSELETARRAEQAALEKLRKVEALMMQLEERGEHTQRQLADEVRHSRHEARVHRLVAQETETDLLYQRKALADRVQRLEAELHDAQAAFADQRAQDETDRVELAEAVVRLNRQITARNHDLAQANQGKDEVRQRYLQEKVALEAQVTDLQRRIQTLKTQDTARSAVLADLRDQLEREQVRVADHDKQIQASTQTLHAELAEVRRREALAREGEEAYRRQVEQLTKTINDLTADRADADATHQAERLRHERQLAELRGRAERVQSDHATLVVELETVRGTLANQTKQWDAKCDRFQRDQADLESAAESSRTQVLRLTGQVHQLEKRYDALREESEGRIESLTFDLAESRRQTNRLRAELTQVHDAQVAQLTADHETTVRTLTHQLDQLRRTYDTLTAQSTAECGELRTALADADADRQAQLEALDLARQKVQHLRQEKQAAVTEARDAQVRAEAQARQVQTALEAQHTAVVQDLRVETGKVRQALARAEQATLRVESDFRQYRVADEARQADHLAGIQQLEEALAAKADELRELQTQLRTVRAEATTAAAQLEQQQMEVQRNRRPDRIPAELRNHYENEIYQLEQQAHQYEQALREVRAKATEEHLALQQERKKIHDAAEDYRHQVESLTTMVETLRNQVAEAEAGHEHTSIQLEQQLQYLQKQHPSVYDALLRAPEGQTGLTATAAGPSALKHKIRHVAQLKDENQRLKRDLATLEKHRDSLRLRIVHLERDLEAYVAVGISGHELMNTRRAERGAPLDLLARRPTTPNATRDVTPGHGSAAGQIPRAVSHQSPPTLDTSTDQENDGSVTPRRQSGTHAAAANGRQLTASVRRIRDRGSLEKRINDLLRTAPLATATNVATKRKRQAPVSPLGGRRAVNSTMVARNDFGSRTVNRPGVASRGGTTMGARSVSRTLVQRVGLFDAAGGSTDGAKRARPASQSAVAPLTASTTTSTAVSSLIGELRELRRLTPARKV
ncbi:hypothetical protein IWQ60_005807 [Tieghemiomyces parasiticus]|uniref:Uncharacterized protein n=1 Tax=Tieghemiomyces parasiticus TaxID=78921 RepID=A0A9W8A5K7_9FUNG|nr:hypothetical protein IWQ60_005807 [Tieghemiomyces parasiticus]